MSSESSVSRPVQIAREQSVVTDSILASRARSRVEAFLAGAERGIEQLACEGCVMKLLCGAVASSVIERCEDDELSVATLRNYGIDVAEGGERVCPGGLVKTAMGRTAAADFWIANDDPLNSASQEVRVAEVLRIAVGDIAARLDNKSVL